MRASRSAGLGFWLFSIDSDGGILRNSQYSSNSLQKRIIRSRGYNRESDSRPQKERTTRVLFALGLFQRAASRVARHNDARARHHLRTSRAPLESSARRVYPRDGTGSRTRR